MEWSCSSVHLTHTKTHGSFALFFNRINYSNGVRGGVKVHFRTCSTLPCLHFNFLSRKTSHSPLRCSPKHHFELRANSDPSRAAPSQHACMMPTVLHLRLFSVFRMQLSHIKMHQSRLISYLTIKWIGNYFDDCFIFLSKFRSVQILQCLFSPLSQ